MKCPHGFTFGHDFFTCKCHDACDLQDECRYWKPASKEKPSKEVFILSCPLDAHYGNEYWSYSSCRECDKAELCRKANIAFAVKGCLGFCCCNCVEADIECDIFRRSAYCKCGEWLKSS